MMTFPIGQVAPGRRHCPRLKKGGALFRLPTVTFSATLQRLDCATTLHVVHFSRQGLDAGAAETGVPHGFLRGQGVAGRWVEIL